jgi:hypothetical protein
MTFASGPLPKAGRGAVVMGGTRSGARQGGEATRWSWLVLK